MDEHEPTGGDAPGVDTPGEVSHGEDTHASTGAAAEHDAHAGPGLIGPEPGVAIWMVITFVILLVVLKKFAWGPILETLDERIACFLWRASFRGGETGHEYVDHRLEGAADREG